MDEKQKFKEIEKYRKKEKRKLKT